MSRRRPQSHLWPSFIGFFSTLSNLYSGLSFVLPCQHQICLSFHHTSLLFPLLPVILLQQKDKRTETDQASSATKPVCHCTTCSQFSTLVRESSSYAAVHWIGLVWVHPGEVACVLVAGHRFEAGARVVRQTRGLCESAWFCSVAHREETSFQSLRWIRCHEDALDSFTFF